MKAGRRFCAAAVLAVSVGCGRSPARREAPVPDTSATPAETKAPDLAAQDTEVSARQVEHPDSAVQALQMPVTVRAIVAGEIEEGARVLVRGTCIGYSRVVALGPQPRTRSDWQLVADSTAIWVVGPYPPGCSGTVPASEPASYLFEVKVDTLPGIGDRPPQPRRYLVYITTE